MDNKKINIDPQFGKLIEPQINKDKVIDNLKEEIQDYLDNQERFTYQAYHLFLHARANFDSYFCCDECREKWIADHEAGLDA